VCLSCEIGSQIPRSIEPCRVAGIPQRFALCRHLVHIWQLCEASSLGSSLELSGERATTHHIAEGGIITQGEQDVQDS
jgi:hypothetical protein